MFEMCIKTGCEEYHQDFAEFSFHSHFFLSESMCHQKRRMRIIKSHFH